MGRGHCRMGAQCNGDTVRRNGTQSDRIGLGGGYNGRGAQWKGLDGGTMGGHSPLFFNPFSNVRDITFGWGSKICV